MPSEDETEADDAGLLVTDDGAIRRITFNRPGTHNAQNPAMLVRLAEVLDDTEA